MGKSLNAFPHQRKAQDLGILEINFFRVMFLLFCAPNNYSEIYFSKVSILPSFEISMTGLKTVRRLQPPVPVLLPLCRQAYLSFALVHNLYLLVQLLLQDCLDTITQWFSTRVPQVQSRGSARSYTNCIKQLNYCIGVPRATRFLHWGFAPAKRLKTTATAHRKTLQR